MDIFQAVAEPSIGVMFATKPQFQQVVLAMQGVYFGFRLRHR